MQYATGSTGLCRVSNQGAYCLCITHLCIEVGSPDHVLCKGLAHEPLEERIGVLDSCTRPTKALSVHLWLR
jgi:hypothetical protein